MNAKLGIFISVFLSGIAQVCLKQGMNHVRKRADKNLLAMGWSALCQPFVLAWAFSFFLATALWLVGLQKVDLSYAYPLVSLGYVLVAVLATVFFKERIDASRWVAIVVICIGVILIAGS